MYSFPCLYFRILHVRFCVIFFWSLLLSSNFLLLLRPRHSYFLVLELFIFFFPLDIFSSYRNPNSY
jgi:hypothetical protein